MSLISLSLINKTNDSKVFEKVVREEKTGYWLLKSKSIGSHCLY